MTELPDGLKQLRAEQARASSPQSHVWLSASAGTGKTHVLAARVFRLLLGGTPPERILCLTFTKAGAAEMANRVHERLAAWVRMKPTEVAADLRALGEDYGPDAVAAGRLLFARVLEATGGGLKIQTIHSFCTNLLAAFPGEAGLIPGFRPLDEHGQAELARATLVDLVVEAEETSDTALLDALSALSLKLGEGEAERYLMRCARAHAMLDALEGEPRAHLLRRLGLPEGEIADALAEACADGAFDCGTLRALASANRDWGTKTGDKIAEIIEAWLAMPSAGRGAALDTLLSAICTGKGEVRKDQLKLGPHAERVADACGALAAMRDLHGWACRAAQGLLAGRAFARAYADAKRRRGVVDFDDLIGWTVRLLREDDMAEWIRYKLDQGIDHILVDEAQDTNRDQWRIVDALVEEYFQIDPEGGDRLRTLFVVGDDKQAIFGFQGTSPDAFRGAQEGFAARALIADQPFAVLPLSESFRSVPAVLEVVDATLAHLGHEKAGLAAPALPHASARLHPGRVELWKPTVIAGAADDDPEAEIAGDEDWNADHVRAHATAIARQIATWTTSPTPLMLEAKGRSAGPGDVMVLVRSRSDLARLIVARLFEEGVPVAGIDRLRLQAPLAARDLVAAMRFAVQPEDELNLASLLVSPLIGWDQERLMAVARRARGRSLWEWLRVTESEESLGPLRALLAAADFMTPYDYLERILSGEMQGRRRLLARLGPEAGDAIDELLNAARGFEREDNPSLQHFIDWFEKGESDIKREMGESSDAVRVLTVHGAKGLQAPIVILADACFDPAMQQRDSAIEWTVDEAEELTLPVLKPAKTERHGPMAEAVEAATRREMQEHWRLLYVAMTRAEELLVVSGALGPRAKAVTPEDSWHRCVESAMAGLGARQEDADLWGSITVWRGRRAYPPAKPAKGSAAIVAETHTLPEWLRTSAPKEARPPRPLAPSAAVEDDLPYPPPGPAMRNAARRGTALHALFERLPAVAVAERRTLGTRWLERQAGFADAAEREALVGEALAIIDDPRFAALFGPDALAEAPVAATVGGIVIAGTIDRMLVEPDRVLLIDFKTGLQAPRSPADVPPAHKRQMAAYVAAIEVIFLDRRVEAGLLYTAIPQLVMLGADDLAGYRPDAG